MMVSIRISIFSTLQNGHVAPSYCMNQTNSYKIFDTDLQKYVRIRYAQLLNSKQR